jgi:hypothetical protein
VVCSAAILEGFIPVPSSIVDEKRKKKEEKKRWLLGYRVVRSNLCENIIDKYPDRDGKAQDTV